MRPPLRTRPSPSTSETAVRAMNWAPRETWEDVLGGLSTMLQRGACIAQSAGEERATENASHEVGERNAPVPMAIPARFPASAPEC